MEFNNSLEILKEPRMIGRSTGRYWIALIVIGDDYRSNWEVDAKDSVMSYAERFGLGVVIFNDFIDTSAERKPAPWQKLLIGESFLRLDPGATGVLIMDTDIIANFLTGENPFETWDCKKIGMVSKRKNMPYDYLSTAKKIAFYRHHFVSTEYPLDSILLWDVSEVYEHEGLSPVEDECCTGILLMNPQNHANFLLQIYQGSLHLGETAAYEQTHVNHSVQTAGLLQTLDYQFQMIWAFEMAQNFPFLYLDQFRDQNPLAEHCVLASLLSGTFLHFAGRWSESDYLAAGKAVSQRMRDSLWAEYGRYQAAAIKGVARGMISPPALAAD